MTGTREKLKSLFGKHRDDSESPPTSPRSPTTSSVRSSRYEAASQGQSPLRGERPISGADQPIPQVQPQRSRSALRKSIDRRSLPASGDVNRRSIDQQYTVNPNTGSAPQMPPVPSSFKDGSTVRPVTSGGQVNPATEAAKVAARRSSNANSNHQPLSTQRGNGYLDDVADRNVIKSQRPEDASQVPAPLNVSKAPGEELSRSRTLSSSDADTQGAAFARRLVGSDATRNSEELDASTKQKQRTSIDKPLPSLPSTTAFGEDPALSQYLREAEDPALSQVLPKDHNYIEKDSRGPISLEGVVDLTNTEDTRVVEHWAPAVTHERVHRDIHHIREEVITREIHNHDYYHRVLPIIDIEVLPARHFVPAGDDQLMEISEDEIPGRSRYNQQWFVGEMMSKLPTSSVARHEPRQFTARQFVGDEGDYKEYISDKGVPTTETTWVHPPVIAEYGQKFGLTQPFYFGTENDGLRVHAPRGRIIGSSRLHAEEQQKLAQAAAEGPSEVMGDEPVSDYLNAVPMAGPSGTQGLTPGRAY